MIFVKCSSSYWSKRITSFAVHSEPDFPAGSLKVFLTDTENEEQDY